MKTMLALLLVLALVACSNPTPPTPSSFYTPDKSWSQQVPSNATTISPEAFEAQVQSGDLRLISSASTVAQEQARAAQYQTDLTALRGVSNPSESLQALLGRTDLNPHPSNGTVVFLDQFNTVNLLATAVRESNDIGNALGVYTSLFATLPDTLQSQVPNPSSLQGQPLTALQTATDAMNTLLEQQLGLDNAFLEPSGAELRPQAIAAGNGADNDLYRPDCRVPKGLVAKFRFPLKNFISPIKNQAKRGTCWAFAAIGAIESRERVQRGGTPNLSEQFFVYKVKGEWDKTDFVDGYDPNKALGLAVSNAQNLPDESFWTYNPAFGRGTSTDTSNAAKDFLNSCDWTPDEKNPNRPRYLGTCSDSAHQGRAVCTSVLLGGVNVPYCAVSKENHTGAGVAASQARTVWSSGQPFLLGVYRALLASGHTILANLPVHKGFEQLPASGILTDRRRITDVPNLLIPGTALEAPGASGNHAVQLVGFIPNETLSEGGESGNALGGGYFILKNSWGCTWGDGGYAYVDADYVQSVFHSLSILEFDSTRSAAWNQAQAGLNLPELTIKTPNLSLKLRVTSDLSNAFHIQYPLSSSVNLNIKSSTGQQVFNGAYVPNGLGNTIPFTPTTVGAQTLTVTASYGSAQTVKTIEVNVVNTPPSVNMLLNYDVYVYNSILGASELIIYLADPNESRVLDLCDNARWETTGVNLIEPELNTISVGGCSKKVRFASAGEHSVRVTVTDSDGLSTTTERNIMVLEPPANPYPIIQSSGVKLWDRQTSLGACLLRPLLGTGATLDLRSYTPTTNCAGQPNPSTYQGTIGVSNPDNEPLTYRWDLLTEVTGLVYNLANSTSKDFAIPTVQFGAGGTYPCFTITKVIPVNDPTRGKQMRTWSGYCTLAPVSPR
jgi:hypothetical protein